IENHERSGRTRQENISLVWKHADLISGSGRTRVGPWVFVLNSAVLATDAKVQNDAVSDRGLRRTSAVAPPQVEAEGVGSIGRKISILVQLEAASGVERAAEAHGQQGIPLSLILKTQASETGVSLLATHTTVPVDTFLYQIPTYRLLEFPGLKNPSSKFPPADKRVSPSFMDCPGVIVFSAKVLVVKKRSKHRKRTNKKASSILEIIDTKRSVLFGYSFS
ncbi:hypothetical protein Godav_019021, partial [Gossypium davidsonii]|nr:hypothetical protein [Gossypium davidsonii]